MAISTSSLDGMRSLLLCERSKEHGAGEQLACGIQRFRVASLPPTILILPYDIRSSLPGLPLLLCRRLRVVVLGPARRTTHSRISCRRSCWLWALWPAFWCAPVAAAASLGKGYGL